MSWDFLTGLEDWILALATPNSELLAPIAFGLGFAESIVVLSWFIPSSAILLGLGAVQQATGGEFWTVWIAAAAGAFLGDTASFAAGRHYKSNVARMWPFSDQPMWLTRTRLVFLRWGAIGIIGSKFLGPIRAFIPVVAGAARMRWPAFLPASAVSCLAWSGAFLAPGFGLLMAFK